MHSVTVRFEVIQARPYLVSLGAVQPRTLEASIDSVWRYNVMYTLLVAVKIVLSAKAFCPCAVRFSADKRLAMALAMFPNTTRISNALL